MAAGNIQSGASALRTGLGLVPPTELDKLFAHLSRLNGLQTGEASILELKSKIANRIAVLISADVEGLDTSTTLGFADLKKYTPDGKLIR